MQRARLRLGLALAPPPPHSYAGHIKGWSAEGCRGQMDLAQRIEDSSEFIPTNVFFFVERNVVVDVTVLCVCL